MKTKSTHNVHILVMVTDNARASLQIANSRIIKSTNKKFVLSANRL